MPDDIENHELDATLSSIHGRSVLYRILSQCNIDGSAYASDSRDHARNEGRREIGVWLLDEIKHISPDKYFLMMKENFDK